MCGFNDRVRSLMENELFERPDVVTMPSMVLVELPNPS